MKVLNVSVRNVMKCSEVDLNLEGHHLFLIGGKNDQGKTSAITALLCALCGRSGMDSYPDILLKEGEDSGSVKVQLSGDDELHSDTLTVELELARKRNGTVVEEFRVLDSEGDEAPEPRTLLKRLYDLKAFDPLAFEKLDKKSKKAMAEKVLGLDFGPSDELYKKKYDERAALNKEGHALKAKFDKMPHFPDAPSEEVDVAGLLEEETRLRDQNDKNLHARTELARLTGNYNAASDEMRKVTSEVVRLENLLTEARQAVLKANLKREESFAEMQAQDALCAGLVDADTAPVRQQIKESGEINRKVRANKDRAEAEKAIIELRKQRDTLIETLDEIKDTQQKMIAAADWPVEGMGMDSEGLTYQGLPFEQASKAVRTRVSVKIGMALNPKLRLLVCQAGGDCDEDTLTELDTILKEQDFQLLLELVTRGTEDEARCAVIMKDGVAVSTAVEQAT